MKNPNPTVGLRKYTGLMMSIIVLVLLVVSLLSLNLFLSSAIRTGGSTISAASGQSSLINQISKDLFLVNSRFQQDMSIAAEQQDLKAAIDRFDDVLNAFAEGGDIVVGSNENEETITIEKLEGEDAGLVLFEADKIWGWYKESVEPVFADQNFQTGELLNARDISERYTGRLADLMNVMSDRVQTNIRKSISFMEIAQYIGILFTALMLIWTILIIVRNLQKNDVAIEQARKETTGILTAVKEGLFLLDHDYVIGNEYSKEVENIFETKDIAGFSFSDIVSDVLSPSKSKTVQEFLALVFDSTKVESLIETLNPMEKIKMSFRDVDGNIIDKFLDFSFHRVETGNKISNVLVAVRDASEVVMLQQQLKDSKDKDSFQSGMANALINADPTLMKEFLFNSQKSMTKINKVLQQPVTDKNDFYKKANDIFVEAHRVKGEASSLQFDDLSERIHEFESQLKQIKNSENVEGLDFLPLTVLLDSLMDYIDSLAKMSKKIFDNTASSDKTVALPTNKSWQHLNIMVQNIAKDLGKDVNFVMTGLNETPLDQSYSSLINSVCTQLIRNSLAHSIEDANERELKNKKKTARIDLRVSTLPNNSIEIVVRDDGRGFDINKLRNSIIESGRFDKADVMNWSSKKVVSNAFETGFSTADTTTMHSGRGVGLDVVRKDIAAVKGHLSISQITNKYCQFEIVLPPVEQKKAIA